jgi:hypothetical protein
MTAQYPENLRYTDTHEYVEALQPLRSINLVTSFS